jgi:dienelactone hydrolase
MKKVTLLACLLLLGCAVEAQQSYNITFQHDGKTVYGTFATPAGNGRFPTIIITPGSGPNDRNGTIPMVGGNAACLYPGLLNDTLKPYKELSDALVDSGYAVLRYDKLEYTYPTSIGTITFHKLWLPVESAIDYIKTRNDVDTNQIILIGHSEGSSTIPYIAKGRSDVKALISIAGSRTPFDSILAYQLVNIAQTCGGDVPTAQTQASQILSYYNTIRTNTWNISTPPIFGVPASVWYDYVRATDSVAINYNIDNLPTLFLGMGLDINVPPAELIRFQNEVTITNDFWSIPGLVHYMTPNNDPHVSEALTDTIVYWLRQHHFTTAIKDAHLESAPVNISPNPFTDHVFVNLEKKHAGDVAIRVWNSVGQPVYFKQEMKTAGKSIMQIDLKEMPAGIYFIELSFDGVTTTKRIAKQ